jgi:hypothetical protein
MTTFYGSSFYSFFFSVEDAETDAATEETVVATMDADVSLMKKNVLIERGEMLCQKIEDADAVADSVVTAVG